MINRFALEEPKYTLTFWEVLEYFEGKGVDFWGFDYEVSAWPNLTETEVKAALQNAFSEYYYFDEIGQETPERFRQRLISLWKLRLDKYDPIFLGYKTHGNKTTDVLRTYGDTGYSRRISEDTPDNKIDLKLKEKTVFPFASFAETGATENVGYSGKSPAKLLTEYMDSKREIIKEFLDSFDELFMEVY